VPSLATRTSDRSSGSARWSSGSRQPSSGSRQCSCSSTRWSCGGSRRCCNRTRVTRSWIADIGRKLAEIISGRTVVGDHIAIVIRIFEHNSYAESDLHTRVPDHLGEVTRAGRVDRVHVAVVLPLRVPCIHRSPGYIF
jgi:hypothetical protein